MKEDFLVPTLIKIFAVSFILIFVFVFFQNCRPTIGWQGSFIWEISYDKQKWLNADLISGDNPRPGIARNLVNKNVLIGKTREEIFEMLGIVSVLPYSKFVTYPLEDIYRFDIDPVASESIVITFDSENKVEKAEIKFYKSSY